MVRTAKDKADKFLKSVFFVTGNRHKVKEVESILGAVRHIDLDLPEIQELDPRKVVLAKAKSAVERGFSPVLIDDTSLSLPALHGLPGPLVKWFLKAIGPDGLYRMAESKGDLRVEVRTIFGLALGPQTIVYGEGAVTGVLVPPRGADFGWDAIVQPDGWTKTFGEMTEEERQTVSMRIHALQDLRNQIGRFTSAMRS